MHLLTKQLALSSWDLSCSCEISRCVLNEFILCWMNILQGGEKRRKNKNIVNFYIVTDMREKVLHSIL